MTKLAKTLLASVAILVSTQTVQAQSMLDVFVSQDESYKDIFMAMGKKCNVDASKADGLWLSFVVASNHNKPLVEQAMTAVKTQDNAQFVKAVNKMQCP